VAVDIWELIGSRAHRDHSFVEDHGVYFPWVKFTIYLDRKPLFYFVNIVIPVMFLVIVVLMVCLLALALASQSVISVSYPYGTDRVGQRAG